MKSSFSHHSPSSRKTTEHPGWVQNRTASRTWYQIDECPDGWNLVTVAAKDSKQLEFLWIWKVSKCSQECDQGCDAAHHVWPYSQQASWRNHQFQPQEQRSKVNATTKSHINPAINLGRDFGSKSWIWVFWVYVSVTVAMSEFPVRNATWPRWKCWATVQMKHSWWIALPDFYLPATSGGWEKSMIKSQRCKPCLEND